MKIHNTISLKTIAFSIFCFLFVNTLIAQDSTKQKSEFWKKVRIGGGIGLSTGSSVFSATLAPSAIYQFNETVALGVGLNGTYYRQKNFVKSTILGGSLIGLYNPIREIQLSAELEQNNVSRNFEGVFAAVPDDNYWQPALFFGAGYRTRNITFGIRYDVLFDDNKSVSANAWAPFVRVYF